MDARLLAGRSFWDAFAVALARPDSADQATLDRLKADAERFLREGLATAARQIPQDAVPPENVVAAKVTLAQVANLAGKHQEAIDLLTGGAQPVTKLIAVEDERKRPAKGIQSRAFASLAVQQLLRAYIGTQQLEPAIVQMKLLEQIGGEGNTSVFVQLGRQIKAELESLPAGRQREAVMLAFDQFLASLSQMQQGQTYGSLLWIGETYFGLAEASAEPKRSTYFDRAAASYGSILSRSGQRGFLPTPDAANGVKLRLAAVEQSRGGYAKAYGLAKQVLKAAPKALNAQVAAAGILGDWGRSPQPDAPSKLLLALQGDESDAAAPVWGWGQIARRLQRAMWVGEPNLEHAEIYRQARYEIPALRRAYANTRPTAERQTELSKAEKELIAYVATTPKAEIGDVWWGKLESLYADLQRDQGLLTVKPLVPATEYVSSAPIGDDPAPSGTTASAPAVATGPAPSSGSGLLPILIGLLVAGGAAGGVAYALLKGEKKRPRYAGTSAGRVVAPVELPAFPAAAIGGSRPAPSSTAPPRPSAPSKTAARPAVAEQPLVAKNVRRTKPNE
jgi:hypothetical protein